MKTFLELQNILEQLKHHKSPEDISKKYNIPLKSIEKQLSIGVPIEHEHTQNKNLATIIALQHLDEFPDYYTRLKKMEVSAGKHNKQYKVSEQYTRIQKTGNTYTIVLNWMGKYKMIQMFFPNQIRPTKKEVEMEINKVYPKATVIQYKPSIKDPTKPYLFAGDYDARPK